MLGVEEFEYIGLVGLCVSMKICLLYHLRVIREMKEMFRKSSNTIGHEGISECLPDYPQHAKEEEGPVFSENQSKYLWFILFWSKDKWTVQA